jgi:hypothetical protein
MNRRQFLQSLIAVGWSATVPASALAAASEGVVDEVWSSALADPMVFYVKQWGTISFGVDEDCPSSRLSLFELAPVTGVADIRQLAGEFWNFTAVLENAWQAHYEAGAFEDWKSWLAHASDEAVEDLVDLANSWLDDPADESDWELANLRGYTEQGAALTYFRDSFAFNDLFNIVIVEGDHPGSTYCAAELHMDVAEANALAIDEGLPIRFEMTGD